jgi:VWFA-related protein
MGRRLALAAAFVVTVFVLGAPAQQPPSPQQQQPPVFRSGAAFVRVDVYPSKDGRIIPGLTKDAFQIFEDGKPQAIETFDYVNFPTFASEEERRDPINKEEGDAMAADPRNRVFVVYLDTFHVSIADGYYARVPLIAMLDRTIGPSDVYGVLTPQQTYADLVFGRKVKSTGDMLTRHWVWGEADQPIHDETSLIMHACYDAVMDESAVALLIARERQDRTFRRLTELVRYLGRLRQERKNLLVFSNGWDLAGPAEYLMTAIDRAPRPPSPTVSLGGKLVIGDRSRGMLPPSTCEGERTRLANEDFRTRFKELLDAAKRANVSFYPVNPAGLSADTGVATGQAPLVVRQVEQRRNAIGTAVDHLRELAGNTDGIAVVDTNDLRTAMMKITDSLSAYYLLGYYPTNAKQDGSVRIITVKGPPGIDLRARRQYIAGDGKEENAKRAAAVTAAASAPAPTPRPPAELDEAFDALARLSAARSEIGGRAAMVSRNELQFVAESARAVSADVDIQLMVTDDAGNPVASGRGRVAAGERSVAIRVAMPAGTTGPWQAVMRVTGGDTRGGDVFQVESPTGVVGDPVLMRITGASSAPAAAPVFSRRERLRATWTTLGASEPTLREARVLDRRGQPLPIDATVTTAPASGLHAVHVDVTLAPLAPGDYVIELSVAAGGATSRRLLAFRVTQG